MLGRAVFIFSLILAGVALGLVFKLSGAALLTVSSTLGLVVTSAYGSLLVRRCSSWSVAVGVLLFGLGSGSWLLVSKALVSLLLAGCTAAAVRAVGLMSSEGGSV